MFKIKVADMVIDYTCHHESFFEHRLKEYIVKDKPSEMCMQYKLLDNITLPEHTVLKKVNDAFIGKVHKTGHLIMYLKSPKTGRIINCVEHNSDYTVNLACAVHHKPTEKVPLTDCDREYLRSGSLFNDRLIYAGGTTLHGSCIAFRGESVIFSAPSGTGKSTHTGLWKEIYGSEIQFVNDDKPALREKDGRIFSYGTPWSGKTELNTNIAVPLKAIVFIGRAAENTIKRISAAEAFCYLNDQTFPPFYDKELARKNLDFIEKLIKSVPVYKLDCNMTHDAARLSCETVFS